MSAIADLLNPLEQLYQTALNLTEKADEQSVDLDKQIAIEETRKAILNEADQVLDEARLFLSGKSLPDTEKDVDLFEQKKGKLVFLINQIRAVDQKREAFFREEKEAIRRILCRFNLEQQAVAKYQQALFAKE